MSNTFTPEQEAAHVDIGPVDLGAISRRMAEGGYRQGFNIHPYAANAVTNRLTGINAICAIFSTGNDPELVTIGPTITAGLITAISCLANDAERVIERCDAAERNMAATGHAVPCWPSL